MTNVSVYDIIIVIDNFNIFNSIYYNNYLHEGLHMEVNRTNIEVRYQETDQMGVVYHANYLIWFEIGRTKYIEQLGFNYAEMEANNIISPVIDVEISYKMPAKYGDSVIVETWLHHYDGVRTTYAYNVVNKDGSIYATGKTVHIVAEKDTFKPTLLRKVNLAWHEQYKNRNNEGC